MKSKTKTEKSLKNVPVWQKEAEQYSRAVKGLHRERRNIKGYDLNTSGMIRSLFNFVESSNWEPSYFRDRRNVPHINFSRTAEIWADNLHTECKHDDWTSDWNPDDRSYRCERDYLDNNTPDFQVLGGRVTVHKSTHKELDNRSKIITIEDIGLEEDRGEEYYNTMAELMELEEEIF